jgi:CPA1 family monovalent cation:H+ antiporter
LPDVPERTAIILTTFLVVAFSLFVQGITMPTLVRRLGIVCGVGEADARCEPIEDGAGSSA